MLRFWVLEQGELCRSPASRPCDLDRRPTPRAGMDVDVALGSGTHPHGLPLAPLPYGPCDT